MKLSIVLIVSTFLLTSCDIERSPRFESVKGDLPDDVATIDLGPGTPLLSDQFTKVISVRELAPDQILIADGGEKRIVFADLSTGKITVVGSTGRGPEEYAQVGILWPLSGDSSVMYDRTLGRWTLLSGSRIVDVVAPGHPAVRATRGYEIDGADSEHVVARTYRWRRGLPLPEPGEVVRVRRSDGRSETISRIAPWNQGKPPELVPITPQLLAQQRADPVYGISLSLNDHVILYPDGWTAIARYDPYRVDWCPPDAECITGPVIDTPKPFTDDAKRAHLAVAQEMLGWPHTNDLTRTRENTWPKIVPPFIGPMFNMGGTTTLHPLPDGRLLIERFPASEPQWSYDIIDRRGFVVGRLTLPRGERIVSVGKSSIYTVAKTEFDLQELRRNALPRTAVPEEK